MITIRHCSTAPAAVVNVTVIVRTLNVTIVSSYHHITVTLGPAQQRHC